MNVIEGSFGRKAPDDLSLRLRELADLVDAGEVKDVIICYIHDNNYTFQLAASMSDQLVMANIMHQKILDSFRL